MYTCVCRWVTLLYSRKLTGHYKPAIMKKIKIIKKKKKKTQSNFRVDIGESQDVRQRCKGLGKALVSAHFQVHGEYKRVGSSRRCRNSPRTPAGTAQSQRKLCF